MNEFLIFSNQQIFIDELTLVLGWYMTSLMKYMHIYIYLVTTFVGVWFDYMSYQNQITCQKMKSKYAWEVCIKIKVDPWFCGSQEIYKHIFSHVLEFLVIKTSLIQSFIISNKLN